jgi:hypothetical protein
MKLLQKTAHLSLNEHLECYSPQFCLSHICLDVPCEVGVPRRAYRPLS